MELDDARKLVATLNALKLTFSGIDGRGGLIQDIDNLASRLERAAASLDGDFKEKLLQVVGQVANEATVSALEFESEKESMDIEGIGNSIMEYVTFAIRGYISERDVSRTRALERLVRRQEKQIQKLRMYIVVVVAASIFFNLALWIA